MLGNHSTCFAVSLATHSREGAGCDTYLVLSRVFWARANAGPGKEVETADRRQPSTGHGRPHEHGGVQAYRVPWLILCLDWRLERPSWEDRHTCA